MTTAAIFKKNVMDQAWSLKVHNGYSSHLKKRKKNNAMDRAWFLKVYNGSHFKKEVFFQDGRQGKFYYAFELPYVPNNENDQSGLSYAIFTFQLIFRYVLCHSCSYNSKMVLVNLKKVIVSFSFVFEEALFGCLCVWVCDRKRHLQVNLVVLSGV